MRVEFFINQEIFELFPKALVSYIIVNLNDNPDRDALFHVYKRCWEKSGLRMAYYDMQLQGNILMADELDDSKKFCLAIAHATGSSKPHVDSLNDVCLLKKYDHSDSFLIGSDVKQIVFFVATTAELEVSLVDINQLAVDISNDGRFPSVFGVIKNDTPRKSFHIELEDTPVVIQQSKIPELGMFRPRKKARLLTAYDSITKRFLEANFYISVGDVGGIESLLVRDSVLVESKDIFGSNLLVSAILQNADPSILQKLLEYNISIYEPNIFGDTAMSLARGKSFVSIFYDANEYKNKQKSLINVVQSPVSDEELVYYLNNVAMNAVIYENLGYVSHFLEASTSCNLDQFKLALNAQYGHQKLTLLMIACKKGDINIVKLLLDKGADFETKNIENRSAITFAMANSNMRIVDELRARGARFPAHDSIGITFMRGVM